MRTTIDMPDGLFRRTKATAAARGISLKQMIVQAVEHELNQTPSPANKRRPPFPIMHLKGKKFLDLSNFDFDDLLT